MKSQYYSKKVTAKGDLSSILQHLFVRSRVKAMSMMGGEQELGVVGSGLRALNTTTTTIMHTIKYGMAPITTTTHPIHTSSTLRCKFKVWYGWIGARGASVCFDCFDCREISTRGKYFPRQHCTQVKGGGN